MTWTDDAACRGKDQRHWFPIAAGQSYQRQATRAGQPDDPFAYGRSICAGCPVRDACLDEALTAQRQGRVLHGLWGGLDEIERRKLLRGEKPARKAPAHGTPAGYKQHGRLGEKACDACTQAKSRDVAWRKAERGAVAS